MSFIESEKSNSSLPFSLNIFDKAWEFLWLLGFFYLVLFLDISSLFLFKKGLFNWSFSHLPELTLGHIGILVIAFGCYSAILLPIITRLFSQLIIEIYYKLPFKGKGITAFPGNGFVSIVSFKRYMLEERSDFLYQMYIEKSIEDQKDKASRMRLKYISMGILIFTITDWYFSLKVDTQSVLNFIYSLIINFDSDISILTVRLIAVGSALFSCIYICLSKEPQNYYYIYYPPLYSCSIKRN